MHGALCLCDFPAADLEEFPKPKVHFPMNYLFNSNFTSDHQSLKCETPLFQSQNKVGGTNVNHRKHQSPRSSKPTGLEMDSDFNLLMERLFAVLGKLRTGI